MFNKVQSLDASKTKNIAFIESPAVSVFPCGKRRSSPIETSDGTHYIPFDPEARLNTEANNTKHVGQNGLAESFVHEYTSGARYLDLSLAGYSFKILLEETASGTTLSINDFGKELIKYVNTSDTPDTADKIYANIVIQDIPLFTGDEVVAKTRVLRDQTSEETINNSLDLLATSTENSDPTPDSYYFSGLSFSTFPRIAEGNPADTTATVYETEKIISTEVSQKFVSLCILKKEQDTWVINQSALLPKIAHGDTIDSVEVYDLKTHNLSITGEPTRQIEDKSISMPAMSLTKLTDGENTYTINFFGVS